MTKHSIIDESHAFWDEVVHPFLAERFPEETAQMAAGVFGYGSEVLRLDDEYSTDHHFGLRVNVLLPEGVMAARGAAIEDALAEGLPSSWRGRELREGYTRTRGVALASLEHHLRSTIGLDAPPNSHSQWLGRSGMTPLAGSRRSATRWRATIRRRSGCAALHIGAGISAAWGSMR
jgi:hypothetical protein